MPYGPVLDRLAAQWAEDPRHPCFAALAEGLRKRGNVEDALTLIRRGLQARPDYLPAHLVLARIALDRHNYVEARSALLGALALDPEHPVAQAGLRALGEYPVHERPAVGDDRGAPQTTEITGAVVDVADAVETPEENEDSSMLDPDEGVPEESAVDAAELATESLASLYERQGHVAEALAVLDALVARAPHDELLVARRDTLRASVDGTQPRPYAAAATGGRSIRDWLAQVAASSSPKADAPVSSFDAFYHAGASAPAAGREHDLDAFQSWLRELGR